MRLSRPSLLPVCPCLALPMSLLLLAGLAGCGPAPSDNAPTLDPRASQGEPPLSQKNPPPRTDPFASAASSATASPIPLAPENGTGPLPGKGTAPVGDSPKAAPVPSAKPANPMDALVIVPGKGTAPVGDSPNAASTPSSKPANTMDALFIPEWIAKDLDSPYIATRLRALETWAQNQQAGSIDPLNPAYGKDDAGALAEAMELITQDRARAAEAGQ